MVCKANKPEINYFNASIIISNQYGRSLVSSNKFYVSPNDNLYKFFAALALALGKRAQN